MHLLFAFFDSRYPGLLCLAVGGYYGWQSKRAATFYVSKALLALLLLTHPPALLLVRFSLEREVALPFALTLFGSSLLLLQAASTAFRPITPPPRWHWLLGALLLLDAVITTTWSSLVPPTLLLLPNWLTAALLLGLTTSFTSLLLYWFWHAQLPTRLAWLQPSPVSRTLARAQYAYEQQAAYWQPTPVEFDAWLRTLPPPAQQVARRAGIELMWTTPIFRRFVLEARGCRQVDFMADYLSAAEFRCWVDVTYTYR